MRLQGIEDLVGETCVSVRVEQTDEDQRLVFVLDTGERYALSHIQACCELVRIEEIVGDLDDLVGAPITQAEESVNSDGDPEQVEFPQSWTWTFYRLGTTKGLVVVRWLGESNGCYSERVDWEKLGG